MLRQFLVILALVAAAMLLLCVRILIKKGGRFSSSHIGHSAAMRRRGITCVQGMDAQMRRENKHRIKEKQNR